MLDDAEVSIVLKAGDEGKPMDSRRSLKVAKRRRKFKRIRCRDVWVKIQSTSLFPSFLGHHEKGRYLPVEDLSRGGISFLSNRHLKVGKELYVDLKTGPGIPPRSLRAQVRHVRQRSDGFSYRIGAAFVDIPHQTWCMLYDFNDKPESDKEVTDKDRSLFDRTREAFALKNWKIKEKWEGDKGIWIRGFAVRGPWRFCWVAEGGYMNSFSVSIYKKGRDNALARPVNEHHIDGVKEGLVDVRKYGLLSLNVTTAGPGSVQWLIMVLDMS